MSYRLLFMLGTCCLVIGFSFAMSDGCMSCQLSTFNSASNHFHSGTSPSTLLLIIFGPVILACGGFYETRTTRDALFPPAAFKNLTLGKKLALSGLLSTVNAN